MKHLFCHSVYHETESIPGGNGDVLSSLGEMKADGIELLTGYSSVDPSLMDDALGVHLPYATDWFTAWKGDADTDGLSEDEVRFTFMGRDSSEIVSNLSVAISYASAVDPAYGVLHAGSVNIDDVFSGKRTHDDRRVLEAVAEMANDAVSGSGGEPPFTIVFENLWWSGLRLIHESGFRLLERKLEFDDWGFCLDTGHMMIALDEGRNETEDTDAVIRTVSEYPEEMKERIKVMHLHSSASRVMPPPMKVPDAKIMDKLTQAYGIVSKTDPHRPFDSGVCTEIVKIIGPEFLTHEISSPSWESRVSDFKLQRGYFP